MNADAGTTETRYQSDKTLLLTGSKITKADILDAFDKEAARVAKLEKENTSLADEVSNLLAVTNGMRADINDLKRKLRTAGRVRRVLRNCLDGLASEALGFLHYEPNQFNKDTARQTISAGFEDVDQQIEQIEAEDEAIVTENMAGSMKPYAEDDDGVDSPLR